MEWAVRTQAPPSCGTRVKDAACQGKDVLADSDEPREQTVDVERTRYDLASRKRGRWTSSTAPVPPGTSASACSGRSAGSHAQFRVSRRRHEGSMAGAELRAALEQRLAALAIRTEVVEHPEVRRSPRTTPGGSGLYCSVCEAKPLRLDVPGGHRKVRS